MKGDEDVMQNCILRLMTRYNCINLKSMVDEYEKHKLINCRILG